MANGRDNFTSNVKNLLYMRVGGVCSNPNCRIITKGPIADGKTCINIGEAAHISAAAPNGPRYNADISTVDRTEIDNGIWLCNNCHTIIDQNPDKYPVELLKKWKMDAENEAEKRVGTKITFENGYSEKQYIEYLVMCFDRDAFHVNITKECCMQDFNQAIDDSIQALNTGILNNRKGDTLLKSVKKNDIKDSDIKELVKKLLAKLRYIKRIMRNADDNHLYRSHVYENGEAMYDFADQKLVENLNKAKTNILEMLNGACVVYGVEQLDTELEE